MKVLITGDTHLGRKNFKITEREKDFQNSFSQIINHAIRDKHSAVLHAGDLFDTGTPSINTILFTINELKRLKKEKIPFFIIAGSHDISVEGTFLKILDNLELAINLTDNKYYEQNDDHIILKCEERNKINVCGIPGKKSRINEILELLKPEIKKDSFNIFMFHHIINDINPLYSDLTKSCLPKGFDLYVSGHWHEFFQSDYNNKKLLYPGSTENCDFREMKGKEKGYIVYDTQSNEYEFVKLNNRKSEIVSINCNNLTTEELMNKMKESIKTGNGEMLLFEIKGRLKKGLKTDINKQEISDIAKNKGYLFSKVYTGLVENPEEEQVMVNKKSINQIEKEFFKNKGLDEKRTILAQAIINGLGNKTNSELLITQIIKELEEEEL